MNDSSTAHRPALGLVLPPSAPPAALWAALDQVDDSGLESVWVTDRTVAGAPWLDCLTVVGAVAARTTRVRVGTSVLVPARRNPVLTAHALMTADYLSGGRLVAGLGLGGLEPAEFSLAGIDPSQSASLTEEFITALHSLSAGHPVAANGAGAVTLSPPLDRRLPVYLGGVGPRALDRVGRLGDGWLSVFTGPDEFGTRSRAITQAAETAGRNPADISRRAYLFAAIGHTENEARAKLAPAIEALFGAPLAAMEHTCIWGTPDDWTATINRFAEHGADGVNFLLFTDDLVGDVQMVCQEVATRKEAV